MLLNPIEDWDLKLSKLALNEIPGGFLSAIVTGERRKGKSGYAFKVTAKIQHELAGHKHMNDEECWKDAFKCFIFGPDDLIDHVFRNIEEDVIDPIWILDDATVHFNPLLFFINPYQVSLLNGMFDTIGTVVNTLILTCPKKTRLMVGLKNYDDLTVQIIRAREGGYQRIARGVLWYTMPDQKQRYRKVFEDAYSCYIPDFIYKPYLIKRKGYLKQVNNLLMALRTQLDKQKQDKFNNVKSSAERTQNEVNFLIQENDADLIDVKENGDGTA